MGPPTDLLTDRRFLGVIHGFERQLAKLLALVLGVAIALATVQLLLTSTQELLRVQVSWFDGGLMQLLDRLLLILIALEVLQNVTAYLRDHAVQIELVLLTAITAVARKVIVLPPGSDHKPFTLIAFGIIVVGLAFAYWLVRQAQRQSGTATQDPLNAEQAP